MNPLKPARCTICPIPWRPPAGKSPVSVGGPVRYRRLYRRPRSHPFPGGVRVSPARRLIHTARGKLTAFRNVIRSWAEASTGVYRECPVGEGAVGTH